MPDHTQHAEHTDHQPRSPVWPLVLIALAAVILRRWQDGVLPLYVHPGFVPYLVVAAIGLLGLAGAHLWRTVVTQNGGSQSLRLSWGVALVSLAVLVAALVPARPLGSALASVQTSQAGTQSLPPLTALADETATWTLLEWSQALNGGVRRERLIGRRVSVVGFVHRLRDRQVAGELLVTRFVVRCCAADGMAVSLPVRHPDADSLAADTWVQVDGVLRQAEDGTDSTVFVEADLMTIVPAPAAPYLSPV